MSLSACNPDRGPEYTTPAEFGEVTVSPQTMAFDSEVRVKVSVSCPYGLRNVCILYMLDGRRMNASANAKVSALSEISMFTEGEDIALADVFTRIYAHTGGKEAISPKESPEKLKAAFAEVLPEYDRDRVHVSDIKKCFAWYNTLVGAGFTEFKLPAENE